jgi:hypothetical protein
MAQYPIPEWLRPPPDPGNQFLQGYGTGSQAAEAQARLQAQAVESQRTHDMEMQRLEISRQYNQQQIGLEQQKVGMQVEEAQRKMAAQQKYQQLVAGGMNAGEALMQVGPDLGLTNLVGAAQMMKALRKPEVPKEMYTKEGQPYFLEETEAGSYNVKFPPKAPLPHSLEERTSKSGVSYMYDSSNGKVTVLHNGQAVKQGALDQVTRYRLDRIKDEVNALRRQTAPTIEDMQEAQAQTPAGGNVMDTWTKLHRMKIEGGEAEIERILSQHEATQLTPGEAAAAPAAAGPEAGAAAAPGQATIPPGATAATMPPTAAPAEGALPAGMKEVVKGIDKDGNVIKERVPIGGGAAPGVGAVPAAAGAGAPAAATVPTTVTPWGAPAQTQVSQAVPPAAPDPVAATATKTNVAPEQLKAQVVTEARAIDHNSQLGQFMLRINDNARDSNPEIFLRMGEKIAEVMGDKRERGSLYAQVLQHGRSPHLDVTLGQIVQKFNSLPADQQEKIVRDSLADLYSPPLAAAPSRSEIAARMPYGRYTLPPTAPASLPTVAAIAGKPTTEEVLREHRKALKKAEQEARDAREREFRRTGR